MYPKERPPSHFSTDGQHGQVVSQAGNGNGRLSRDKMHSMRNARAVTGCRFSWRQDVLDDILTLEL